MSIKINAQTALGLAVVLILAWL